MSCYIELTHIYSLIVQKESCFEREVFSFQSCRIRQLYYHCINQHFANLSNHQNQEATFLILPHQLRLLCHYYQHRRGEVFAIQIQDNRHLNYCSNLKQMVFRASRKYFSLILRIILVHHLIQWSYLRKRKVHLF